MNVFPDPYAFIQRIIRTTVSINDFCDQHGNLDPEKINSLLPGINDFNIQVPVLFYIVKYPCEKYLELVRTILQSKLLCISKCVITSLTGLPSNMDLLNCSSGIFIKDLLDYGFTIDLACLRERFITGLTEIDQVKAYLETGIMSINFINSINYDQIVESICKCSIQTFVDPRQRTIIMNQLIYNLALMLKMKTIEKFTSSHFNKLLTCDNENLVKRILRYYVKDPTPFDIESKEIYIPETMLSFNESAKPFDHKLKMLIKKVFNC